jgi:hypothetical protein
MRVEAAGASAVRVHSAELDVSAIEAELGVRRTLAAYCHLCDDAEFESLAEQFAADGVFIFLDEVVTGRPALAKWFEARQPSERRGKHLTTNTIVEVDGDHARAVSDFLFVVATPAGVQPTMTGRYRDELTRVDGRWLITRREATLLRHHGR